MLEAVRCYLAQGRNLKSLGFILLALLSILVVATYSSERFGVPSLNPWVRTVLLFIAPILFATSLMIALTGFQADKFEKSVRKYLGEVEVERIASEVKHRIPADLPERRRRARYVLEFKRALKEACDRKVEQENLERIKKSFKPKPGEEVIEIFRVYGPSSPSYMMMIAVLIAIPMAFLNPTLSLILIFTAFMLTIFMPAGSKLGLYVLTNKRIIKRVIVSSLLFKGVEKSDEIKLSSLTTLNVKQKKSRLSIMVKDGIDTLTVDKIPIEQGEKLISLVHRVVEEKRKPKARKK